MELPPAKKQKTTANDRPILIWFRADLRTSDNPALTAACRAASTRNVPLIALFIACKQDWKRHDVAPIRAHFYLRSLSCLKERLRDLNVPLATVTVEESRTVPSTLSRLCSELRIEEVHWNVEYEINELRRDAKIKKLLKDENFIDCFEKHDQCIVLPGEVKTLQGKPYGIFTPFKNSWIKHVSHNRDLLVAQPVPTHFNASSSQETKDILERHSTIPPIEDFFKFGDDEKKKAIENWPAGEVEGHARLEKFVSKVIKGYKASRDHPSLDGTSTLSPFLTSGCVSTRQCVALAMKENNNRIETGQEGINTWISELIWRDFYRQVMVAFPRVCMHKPYKLETDNIEWQNDDDAFKAWCDGKTGYPIVDAGMRQLNSLGWMHNRLRMITAMFLTKHLMQNWRKGENYFSLRLVDGDLASNNGGWQWAASTGTDSQPYFRIFNPLLQSEKFDANGKYIRKWVPELKELDSRTIHDPHARMSTGSFKKLGYPKPIVEHKAARERCLAAFKKGLGVGKKA